MIERNLHVDVFMDGVFSVRDLEPVFMTEGFQFSVFFANTTYFFNFFLT